MKSGAVLARPAPRALAPLAPSAAESLDVLDQFGPLASMHAALEAAGIGTPCGVIAHFEGRSCADIQAAIAVARRQFPVLQTRLAWRRGRPVLEPHKAGAPGGVWDHEVVPDDRGAWFHGRWAHAAADGRSMLRFVQALAAQLGGPAAPLASLPVRPAGTLRPMASWLPGFLADQHRSYVRMASVERSAAQGVSWLIASPEDRDRVLGAAAESCGGFLGPLAAAAATAFCEQQTGGRGGLVSLNVPIARADPDDLGGFGFAVGSLLLPVSVRPGVGHAELGQEIARRARRLAAEGFDRNLDRFLGRDPMRHRLFSAIRARRPPDAAVTVSWKGRHELGAEDGLGAVACFAASPTLHVSGHADRNGLSISVSSRQAPARRLELLHELARRLGLRAFRSSDLDQIATGPL